MNPSIKKGTKIAAGIVGIGLIGFILFVTNAFVGNPVSAHFANQAIHKYVEEKYGHLDLETEKVYYNFKDSAYVGRAVSPTSVDTHFAVYYRNGEVYHDDYEGYVVKKYNTVDRMGEEYSQLTQTIVANELGFKGNTTKVMYDSMYYSYPSNHFEIDMKFDRSIEAKAEVMLRLELKDQSVVGIVAVFENAHEAFLKYECTFQSYSLFSEDKKTDIMVTGIKPSHIESGNLKDLIQKALDGDNAEGIYVNIYEK